jgi:hypothetical protein
MNTLKVFWKDKFAGRAVSINETDFGPSIHRRAVDGPWPKAEESETEPDADAPDDLQAMTVAQLRDLAEDRGVELKSSMTKAAIIEAIEYAE